MPKPRRRAKKNKQAEAKNKNKNNNPNQEVPNTEELLPWCPKDLRRLILSYTVFGGFLSQPWKEAPVCPEMIQNHDHRFPLRYCWGQSDGESYVTEPPCPVDVSYLFKIDGHRSFYLVWQTKFLAILRKTKAHWGKRYWEEVQRVCVKDVVWVSVWKDGHRLFAQTEDEVLELVWNSRSKELHLQTAFGKEIFSYNKISHACFPGSVVATSGNLLFCFQDSGELTVLTHTLDTLQKWILPGGYFCSLYLKVESNGTLVVWDNSFFSTKCWELNLVYDDDIKESVGDESVLRSFMG